MSKEIKKIVLQITPHICLGVSITVGRLSFTCTTLKFLYTNRINQKGNKTLKVSERMKGFIFIKPIEVTRNEYLPRGSSLAALSLSKTFATRICPVVSSTTNYNRGSRTAHPSQDREKSQRAGAGSSYFHLIRILCRFSLLTLFIYNLFCRVKTYNKH